MRYTAHFIPVVAQKKPDNKPNELERVELAPHSSVVHTACISGEPFNTIGIPNAPILSVG